MQTGKFYTVNLVGTKKSGSKKASPGKAVKFTVGTKVADESTHLECGNRRRAEVAYTRKGTLVGRKLLVCCDKMNGGTRKEEWKAFKTLSEAASWFEKKFPEEARVAAKVRAYKPLPPPPPPAEEI